MASLNLVLLFVFCMAVILLKVSVLWNSEVATHISGVLIVHVSKSTEV